MDKKSRGNFYLLYFCGYHKIKEISQLSFLKKQNITSLTNLTIFMIIFLYGRDTFRSRQKLKELKDRFIREVDPSGGSLETVSGAEAGLEEINSRVSPGSLLSKKRMIVIEDIFLNKTQTVFEEILDFFKKRKSDDNIIIFWDSAVGVKVSGRKKEITKIDSSGREHPLPAKQLKLFNFLVGRKYAQEFKSLSNLETADWIKKEIKKRGGEITNQAAQTIVSLLGNDLWQIDNEINKLVNYKLGLEPKMVKGGRAAEIQAEEVERLVRGRFDENIFALTDAISNKNKALAVKLLEEQYEAGLTDVYLMAMIVRQFRILLQIRQALDAGATSRKIISSLKLHPFVAQKGINQVRNFSLPVLKNILSQLVKIDYNMKTGRADMKTMLNLLFVKI